MFIRRINPVIIERMEKHQFSDASKSCFVDLQMEGECEGSDLQSPGCEPAAEEESVLAVPLEYSYMDSPPAINGGFSFVSSVLMAAEGKELTAYKKSGRSCEKVSKVCNTNAAGKNNVKTPKKAVSKADAGLQVQNGSAFVKVSGTAFVPKKQMNRTEDKSSRTSSSRLEPIRESPADEDEKPTKEINNGHDLTDNSEKKSVPMATEEMKNALEKLNSLELLLHQLLEAKNSAVKKVQKEK